MWALAKEYGGQEKLGTAPMGPTLAPQEEAARPAAWFQYG